MLVTCPRDALLAAVKLCASVVAARTTSPVLANLKAVAEGDTLTLSATDTEVGVRVSVRGATVARPGVALLPPSRLASVLTETRDADITLNGGGGKTLVRTSAGRFELPDGNAAEFPDSPDGEGESHEVEAGVLKTLLRRAAFAATRADEARYATKGVLWEADAARGVCRLVATDTRRLALAEGPASVKGGADAKPSSHLVPIKAVQLLERALLDGTDAVRVTLGPAGATFSAGRVVIHTKLLEGRFPPYTHIVPRSHKVRLTLPAAGFHAAVRQAAVMTDGESRRVRFDFDPDAGLTLSSSGPHTGSGVVNFPLAGFDGPAVSVMLDPSYLTEMLRAIDGVESVTLEMADGARPVVFRLGECYTYVVMPMGK